MYEQVEKSIENKSRAVANSVVQKKSHVKQAFGFFPHETWNVVPQKFGIVKSTIQLKLRGNDQKKHNAGHPPIQRIKDDYLEPSDHKVLQQLQENLTKEKPIEDDLLKTEIILNNWKSELLASKGQPGRWRWATTTKTDLKTIDIYLKKINKFFIKQSSELNTNKDGVKSEMAIFGLQGRTIEQIKEAIKIGYKKFDSADTYGDTINYLAEAIEQSQMAREKFTIIYKIATTDPEKITDNIKMLAAKFDGWIDEVIIHKTTDDIRTNNYIEQLKALKGNKTIKRIGSGDPRQKLLTSMKDNMDSYEISATDLYEKPNSKKYRETLKDIDKPVYVYNIISSLNNMTQAIGEKNLLKGGNPLGMFLSILQSDIPKALPILSSSDGVRMGRNLRVAQDFYGEEPNYDVLVPQKEGIEKGYEKMQTIDAVPINNMSDQVKNKLHKIINELPSSYWTQAILTDNEVQATNQHIEKSGIKTENQEQNYRGVNVHEDRLMTLGTMLTHMKAADKNCDRVLVYEFLTMQ